MADFLKYAPKIFEFEGLISNDANDPGGFTIWGLTKVADKDWQGWQLVDEYIKKNPQYPHGISAIKEQLKQLAIPYYKAKYWDAIKADAIEDQELAEQMCDEAINAGKGQAVKEAEAITGELQDGKMDNQLLNKLNNEG